MVAELSARVPAVVMGLSPTGLHVVRALGKAGVRVIGIGEGIQSGRFSRFLDEFIKANSAHSKLTALIERFPCAVAGERPVLIPTSDEDVQVVIDNWELLADRYEFQGSYRNGLAARILAKDSFYDLCAKHGVRYPKIWDVPKELLPALLPELTFPCLIKPARIHDLKTKMRGRKVWIVRNATEYQETIGSLPETQGSLLVQQIIPGPESEITLCCLHRDRQGQERQVFTARKLRQYPPGFGSASLVESEPERETERISRGFLRSLSYHGIAALEFKRHPDNGELYMIEVNVRPSLWFAISSASGRDTVLAAYNELAGETRPLVERPQVLGVRWRYTVKDLASELFYRFHRDFILPPPAIPVSGARVRHVGAVFEVGDAWPAIGELVNWAAKFPNRLMKTAFRGRA